MCHQYLGAGQASTHDMETLKSSQRDRLIARPSCVALIALLYCFYRFFSLGLSLQHWLYMYVPVTGSIASIICMIGYMEVIYSGPPRTLTRRPIIFERFHPIHVFVVSHDRLWSRVFLGPKFRHSASTHCFWALLGYYWDTRCSTRSGALPSLEKQCGSTPTNNNYR